MTRKRKIARILIWLGVGLLVAVFAFTLALKALLNSGALDARIKNEARKRFGLELSFERLTYSFPFSVVVIEPQVLATGAPAGTAPVTCHSVAAVLQFDRWNSARIEEIAIQGLNLELELNEQFRLASMPAGLDLLLKTSAVSLREPVEPGTEPGAPTGESGGASPHLSPEMLELLPGQFRLEQLAVAVRMPNQERADLSGQVLLQRSRVQGKPILLTRAEGSAFFRSETIAFTARAAVNATGLDSPVHFTVQNPTFGRAEGEFSMAGENYRIAGNLLWEDKPLRSISKHFPGLKGKGPKLDGDLSGKVPLEVVWTGGDVQKISLKVRPQLVWSKAKFSLLPYETWTAEKVELSAKVEAAAHRGAFSIVTAELKLNALEPSLGASSKLPALDSAEINLSALWQNGEAKLNGSYSLLAGKQPVNGRFDLRSPLEWDRMWDGPSEIEMKGLTCVLPGLSELKFSGRLTEHLGKMDSPVIEFQVWKVSRILERLEKYLPLPLALLNVQGAFRGKVSAPLFALASAGKNSGKVELRYELETSNLRVMGLETALPSVRKYASEFQIELKGSLNGNASVPIRVPRDAEGRAALSIENLQLQWKDPNGKQVTSRAALSADLGYDQGAISAGGKFSVPSLGESLRGEFEASRSGTVFSLKKFNLVWPGIASVHASATADLLFGRVRRLKLILRTGQLRACLAKLDSFMPRGLRDLSPAGSVSLTIRLSDLPLKAVRGMHKINICPFQVEIEADSLGLRLPFRVPIIPAIEGRIMTTTHLYADIPGYLVLPDFSLGVAGFRNLEISTEADASWGKEKLLAKLDAGMSLGHFRVDQLHLCWPEKFEIAFDASGKSRPGNQRPIALVGNPTLFKQLAQSISFTVDKAEWRLGKCDLAKLYAACKDRLPRAWQAYTPSGNLRAHVIQKGFKLPGTEWPEETSAIAEIDQFNLLPTDPNAVEGIENADLHLEATLKKEEKGNACQLSFSGDLAKALLYRDIFIFELGDRQAKWALQGKTFLDRPELQGAKGFLEIEHLARLDFNDLATVRKPELALSAQFSLSDLDNDRLLAELRSVVGDAWNWLGQIQLTGRTSFSSRLVAAPGKIRARGKLQIEEAGLRYAGTRFEGFRLDFPFSIVFPSAEPGTLEVPFGALKVARMRTGFFSLDNLDLSLKLEENQFKTKSLAHPLYGGQLKLSGFETTDLLRAGRRAEGRLELSKIGLRPWLGPLVPGKITGELNADMKSIVFKESGFSLDASAHFSVFGGQVDLEQLQVRDLGSDLSTLKMDLKCRDLSVEKMTEMVPGFGKMTGVLEGGVSGLEVNLAAGQPSRFSAAFRTARRKGIGQMISGEAVRHLSLAGGGKFASQLANLPGLHPYKAFGFEAELKNDRLTIRGTRRGKTSRGQPYEEILTPPLLTRTPIRIRFPGSPAEYLYAQVAANLQEAFKSLLAVPEKGIEVKVK